MANLWRHLLQSARLLKKHDRRKKLSSQAFAYAVLWAHANLRTGPSCVTRSIQRAVTPVVGPQETPAADSTQKISVFWRSHSQQIFCNLTLAIESVYLFILTSFARIQIDPTTQETKNVLLVSQVRSPFATMLLGQNAEPHRKANTSRNLMKFAFSFHQQIFARKKGTGRSFRFIKPHAIFRILSEKIHQFQS